MSNLAVLSRNTERTARPEVTRHPCFDPKARARWARVHLPVAPACNISCKFCDRRFDCTNESRPGVTSVVLSPWQALSYLDGLVQRRHDVAVVGIAGPGDPMANPDATLETLRLVRARHPELLLCLASNGLALTEHVAELQRLHLSHLTITINTLNPAMVRASTPGSATASVCCAARPARPCSCKDNWLRWRLCALPES